MNAVIDQNLTPTQVTLLTNAMLSVAMLDGLHPAETELIRRFYESARSEDMLPAEAMIRAGAAHRFDFSELSGSTPEFAETVVLMCLMAGYADGNLGEAEREKVKSIAISMGMNQEQLAAQLAHVHNDLIGALSHLPDSASVAQVFGELSSDI